MSRPSFSFSLEQEKNFFPSLSLSHSLGWWTYFFVRLVLPILLVVLLFISCSRLCCTPVVDVVVVVLVVLFLTVVKQRLLHTYIHQHTPTPIHRFNTDSSLAAILSLFFVNCFFASDTSHSPRFLSSSSSTVMYEGTMLCL